MLWIQTKIKAAQQEIQRDTQEKYAMNLSELNRSLEGISKKALDLQSEIQILESEKLKIEKSIKNSAKLINSKSPDLVDEEQFLKFFEKPYVIEEKCPRDNHIIVSIPKFKKDFQIGWLVDDSDSTFYKYRVDQYSAWFDGELPKDIQSHLGINEDLKDIEVEGNTVIFNPGAKEKIKEILKNKLSKISENQARIKEGSEFDVIAKIIESGKLPFRPRPISKDDLREHKTSIELLDYQQEPMALLRKTGAVGVFLPTGAGKSFVSMYAADEIKGRKLIVTFSRALVGQWNWYLDKYAPEIKNEFTLITYAGAKSVQGQEFALTIFDECHRLPANTFSKLALLKTKYRLGLSATPFREDGRTSLILALTGHPVGLNWPKYMKMMNKTYHPVQVYVVKTPQAKIIKCQELLNFKKKTVVFCDSIQLGHKLSGKFNIPFVSGETKNPMDIINQNNMMILSRIGDQGIHIDGLQRIIEIDFLFGSRSQELQRTGRLLHSDLAEKHDIIMTEDEMNQYGKRLWSLQEKGFHIKIIGGSS